MQIEMRQKKNATHKAQVVTTNSSSRKPITLGIFTWTSNLGKTVLIKKKKKKGESGPEILQVLAVDAMTEPLTRDHMKRLQLQQGQYWEGEVIHYHEQSVLRSLG